MATLPADQVGEVRLTMRRDLGDGTNAPVTGYAILSPHLEPGTRYRASNVDPIVAADIWCPFDGSGQIRDPENEAGWPKVLASDASGLTVTGLQYKLEFRIDDVDEQPRPVYFTVPRASYVNVGLLADTTKQPGVEQVYLDAGGLTVMATEVEQHHAEVMAVPTTTDGIVAALVANKNSSTYANLHPGLGKILIVGDSIGTGTYPNWMEGYLLEQGYRCTVVNGSASGSTTTVELAALPGLLATHAPQFVVFQVSINDNRLDVVHPVETTASNVLQALNLIRKAGAVPIIVGSGPIDPAWFNQATFYTLAAARAAIAANTRIAQLCASEGAVWVDIFAAMFRRVGVLSDGVHPNDAGSAVWGQTIADAIVNRTTRSTRKIVFSDTFDRPNSTTTLGSLWSVEAGTWGVVDKTAYSATQADGDQVTAAVGRSNYAAQLVVNQTAGLAFGMPFRYTNSTNYYLTNVDAGGILHLYTRIGGTFTELATATVTSTGTDELVAVADGSHLMVFYNGLPQIALTDTAFGTGERVGMRQGTSALARFDKVVVTA